MKINHEIILSKFEPEKYYNSLTQESVQNSLLWIFKPVNIKAESLNVNIIRIQRNIPQLKHKSHFWFTR